MPHRRMQEGGTTMPPGDVMQIVEFLRPEFNAIRNDLKALNAEVVTVRDVALATERQARLTNGRVTVLEEARDAEKDERIKALQAELEKAKSVTAKKGVVAGVEGKAVVILFGVVAGSVAAGAIIYLGVRHPEAVGTILAWFVKRVTLP